MESSFFLSYSKQLDHQEHFYFILLKCIITTILNDINDYYSCCVSITSLLFIAKILLIMLFNIIHIQKKENKILYLILKL